MRQNEGGWVLGGWGGVKSASGVGCKKRRRDEGKGMGPPTTTLLGPKSLSNGHTNNIKYKCFQVFATFSPVLLLGCYILDYYLLELITVHYLSPNITLLRMVE